jgi:hypothetical protein
MSITLSSLLNQPQLGTSQSLSGTAVGFTGIPAGVKQIQFIIQGASASNTDDLYIQVGSGSYATTGYISRTTAPQSGNVVQTIANTTAFNILNGSAANAFYGVVNLVNITANTWVCQINVSSTTGSVTSAVLTGGSISLAGVLDRVRITLSGAGTFDAGSVNIIYQ